MYQKIFGILKCCKQISTGKSITYNNIIHKIIVYSDTCMVKTTMEDLYHDKLKNLKKKKKNGKFALHVVYKVFYV